MEILFGGLWRLVDGRDWKPSGWNIVLVLGLGFICYDTFGLTWTALAVMLITGVNILSGYKSFTWPWLEAVGLKIYYGYWYRDKPHMKDAMFEEIELQLEESGWHSFHTTTRFLIPIGVILLVLYLSGVGLSRS